MGSSRVRDWTRVSCIGRRILYHWATREVLSWTFWVRCQPPGLIFCLVMSNIHSILCVLLYFLGYLIFPLQPFCRIYYFCLFNFQGFSSSDFCFFLPTSFPSILFWEDKRNYIFSSALPVSSGFPFLFACLYFIGLVGSVLFRVDNQVILGWFFQ